MVYLRKGKCIGGVESYMELVLGFLTAVVLMLVRRAWDKPASLGELRDVPLDPERLKLHAADVAKAHGTKPRLRTTKILLKRLEANYDRITAVYQYLHEKAKTGKPMSPASEWILDNYYLVEEQAKAARQELQREGQVRLPVLDRGPLQGYPRIYAIALELVSHTDGRLEQGEIMDFVAAYQEHRVLTQREIEALPLMLKAALLEYLAHLTGKIHGTETAWDEAHRLTRLPEENRLPAVETFLQGGQGNHRGAFAMELLRELRAREKEDPLESYLVQYFQDLGTTLEKVIEQEHYEQAARKVSTGNAIVSLKAISLLDWEEITSSLNRVEQLLRHDPEGLYAALDQPSKAYYRHQISLLAGKFRVPETRVARLAVGLAKQAAGGDHRAAHVGYYLVGEGRGRLAAALRGQREEKAVRPRSPFRYTGSIGLVTTLILLLVGWYASREAGDGWAAAVAVLAALLPASDLAVFLVNRLASRLVKPAFLPKLSLAEGIPAEMATMVVIPSLLPSAEKVEELLERLETYYLANREENLYFALAGDLKDAAEPTLPQDEEIRQAGLAGVARLNRRYGAGKEIFFYCQRERKLCPTQGRYTGWERKRGALVEFNRLLLGAGDTSYTTVSPGLEKIQGKIRYVITLDADTRLPLDTAKKLIGTLAHPLHRAVVDRKRGVVVKGYGLIQPRIGIGIESAHQSLFTRLFAGSGGIDPYTTAVSDVYQDLFGEGIFTGKGIYDLQVFHELLTDAIPEGCVLSHDLLEGSYLRTGLATDIELLDGYPGSYAAFAARQHRWVRGDWQLLPWLGRRVRDRQGRVVANPLSSLSKWKIFDNLRRSAVPIGQLALIFLGLAWLPGHPLVWLGLALLPYFLSPLAGLVRGLMVLRPGQAWREEGKAFLQGLLLTAFLPHQAWLALDAIARTLYRLLVSRRHLLEWVTAAEVERSLKNDLPGFVRRMQGAVFLGVILIALTAWMRPGSLAWALALGIAWVFSPWLGYQTSRPLKRRPEPLEEEDVRLIRRLARRTWAYYEDFANEENNYLPPDNYQLDPPNGLAYRTSPTNIGFLLMAVAAARDFGFITTSDLIHRLRRTLATIEKLETWRGHLFNWYHTKTLEPLRPLFISTVDSGNLAGYLLVVARAVAEYRQQPLWGRELLLGLRDTHQLAFPGEDFPWPDFAGKAGSLPPEPFRQWLQGLKERMPAETPWQRKFHRLVELVEEEMAALLPNPETMALLKAAMDAAGEEERAGALPLWEGGATPAALVEVYRRLLEVLPRLNLPGAEACAGELRRALARAGELLGRLEETEAKLEQLFAQMDFRPLYDRRHDLFAIGYDKEEERLTNSYYDLLASEARLISYLAICRREVPPRHWFKLGRALAEVEGQLGLVSWTGTMFEYLMPSLVMKHYPHTLLDMTYRTALLAQEQYGKKRKVPWGTSESGYYAFDLHFNYQYKAFGVPDLGLKRGLIEDMVVSPYSTMLALPFLPGKALVNLKRLLADGLEGEYGLYEAVDYTPERLPPGEKRKIVLSFMAHHQGMSLVAMDNLLHGQVMQRRFHAHPLVKSGEILLEERVPSRPIITKDYKEKVEPLEEQPRPAARLVRTFELEPRRVLPRCHVVSNGRYYVLLTDRGTGYSRREGVQLTRWRKDCLLGGYGFHIFFKCLKTNRIWSAAYEPLRQEPDSYQVTFAPDKVTYTRVDDLLSTHTEIVVAPEDDVEIRRVTVANNSREDVVLEVTSYGELVLGDHQADVAHPAFHSLFVKTEALPEEAVLLASRRPRAKGQPCHWAFHSLVVDGEMLGQLQFETNRGNFLGRNRALYQPQALERPLGGSTGTVLDPIFSLRQRVRVQAEGAVTLTWLFGYAESREQALALARKYRNGETVLRAFEMAQSRGQVEANFLALTEERLALYQDLIPHLLFLNPLRSRYAREIARNQKGQPGLWAYGISGDHPVVLVTVAAREGLGTVREMLKAHEYWRLKGLTVDLVILNEDQSRYFQPLQELLQETVAVGYARHWLDRPGGIFLRQARAMPEEDRRLLYAVAAVVIDAGKPLAGQLRLPLRELPPFKTFAPESPVYEKQEEPLELQLWNGYGGFSLDGKEYVIRLREGTTTPAPWINVVANPRFGFQVSESGAGFTWAENSRENKLTPWSNDPVTDPVGEAVYLRDDVTGARWSITPQPRRDEAPYTVHHGRGYTRFHHHSQGLAQEQVVFVPLQDPVKITLVRLTNQTESARQLSLYYYLRPVLGVTDEVTAPHIITAYEEAEQVLTARNPYNTDFPGRLAFVAASEAIASYTGDRVEFIGPAGTLADPEALRRERLSNTVGAGLDPCLALELKIHLGPGEQKEVVLLLGQAAGFEEVLALVRRYRDLRAVQQALAEVQSFWDRTLGVIQVRTPEPSLDLLMNGWLMYQNIACRLWARSAFYQCGGAFGYRDQLQDSLNAIYISPEITKEQLLLHAAHQFREGDVLHWWHPGAGDRGVRTRFTDDRLWLPYVLVEYLERTGDYEILHQEAPYLEGEELPPGEDERYFTPRRSAETGTLYDHCLRAIEVSLKFGRHGLPLMGSGDWNDGMSTVGNQGQGESVWLGWFLLYILKKFAPLCRRQGDEERARRYEEIAAGLAEALEKDGWDGAWYRRAYFDDGTPLGSAVNSECSIDSLSQSWAVIAGSLRPERREMALAAVEQNLVDRDLGLIKLFTPPFENGDLEPGYIKGYVAGVRENGAQYTHAAAWVIKAFAMLGQGDKAGELFHMINPINHARTPIECTVYKVEPYVVAADVYSVSPQAGRGGWTWYTGAAGWLYRVALEDILGFKLKGQKLFLNPCIPKSWSGFEINYRYGNTWYRIQVENPQGVNGGVREILLDGRPVADGVPLADDGKTHRVQVRLAANPAPVGAGGFKERRA